MGSSCSILNDTEYDVWITERINWQVLKGVSAGVAALLLIAIGIVLDSKGIGESVLQTLKMGEEGANIANMISKKQKKKQTEDLQEFREFQAAATLIRPGEKYTWSGTLSLTKRVHVMNELHQFDDKACFTGPTHGSENVYRISEHFTRLDVRER